MFEEVEKTPATMADIVSALSILTFEIVDACSPDKTQCAQRLEDITNKLLDAVPALPEGRTRTLVDAISKALVASEWP
jgi:KaiC/GvpD/RAD55 family RecA-like ATPase